MSTNGRTALGVASRNRSRTAKDVDSSAVQPKTLPPRHSSLTSSSVPGSRGMPVTLAAARSTAAWDGCDRRVVRRARNDPPLARSLADMARCPGSGFRNSAGSAPAVRASCVDAGRSPAAHAGRGVGAGSVPSPGTCHRTHERNLMNKAELVSAIAKRADVPASTVDSVLAGLQEELVDAITRGEKVAVSGLLTVERTQRSARTGRNPQTGESIDIPAANTVKVTAGSNLKKAASSVPV